ncbi:MAG: GTPase [Candidatus Bathyarchaeia archaeon]|jgi:GTP-binding protein EngB required for normal cell division
MQEKYLVFTGRPNAGKSSIIKQLVGLNIAIGKHPGTTRTLKHYPLKDGLVLVDFPGLGKMLGSSKKYEEKRNKKLVRFLEHNAENIVLAVVVLDISTFIEVTWRLEKKGIMSVDVEMVKFLAQNIGEFPLVAANKIDKTNKQDLETNLNEFLNRISDGEPAKVKNNVFAVSATKGTGIGELKKAIHEILVAKGYKTPFKM